MKLILILCHSVSLEMPFLKVSFLAKVEILSFWLKTNLEVIICGHFTLKWKTLQS